MESLNVRLTQGYGMGNLRALWNASMRDVVARKRKLYVLSKLVLLDSEGVLSAPLSGSSEELCRIQ